MFSREEGSCGSSHLWRLPAKISGYKFIYIPKIPTPEYVSMDLILYVVSKTPMQQPEIQRLSDVRAKCNSPYMQNSSMQGRWELFSINTRQSN